MPGLGAPVEEGGCGFDYRLAMGVPDCWFKLSNDIRDEDWDMGWLWHELTNRRREERTVSYVESHDQALVGGKTFIFELVGRRHVRGHAPRGREPCDRPRDGAAQDGAAGDAGHALATAT